MKMSPFEVGPGFGQSCLQLDGIILIDRLDDRMTFFFEMILDGLFGRAEHPSQCETEKNR